MTPPPDGPGNSPSDTTITTLLNRVLPEFKQKYPNDSHINMPRADIARDAKQTVADFLARNRIELNLLDQRDLVTALVNSMIGQAAPPPQPAPPIIRQAPEPISEPMHAELPPKPRASSRAQTARALRPRPKVGWRRT